MAGLKWLRQAYFRLGVHGAPPGTLLHRLHRTIEAGYFKAMREGVISSSRGSSAGPVRRSIGDGHAPVGPGDADRAPVAFRITGGVGDHLIAARYIRDLLAAAGDFRFDIYSSGPAEAKWMFASFGQLNECLDEQFSWERNLVRYSLAVHVTTFVFIHEELADWRWMSGKSARLTEVGKAVARYCRTIEPVIAEHPRMNGFLARKAVFMGKTRKDFAHAISGLTYGGDRFPLRADGTALTRFGLADKRYITVHNGFSRTQELLVGRGRVATKCYPHFDRLVGLLHERFPGLSIVQLGSSTSSPIKGVDLNLKDQTTLPEAAAVIQGSILHLDVESGLVHLAACVGTKCCVVFGPTDHEFFSYEGNINVPPPFCGGCWWITDDWLSKCPRGFSEPRCMSERSPQAIVEAIVAAGGLAFPMSAASN